MSRNRKSLSDKINELVNPNPVWEDPENDFSETAAKIVEKLPEEFDEDDLPPSAPLIYPRCEFLVENDDKYSGKMVSRKSFEAGISSMEGFSKNLDDAEVSEDEITGSEQSNMSSSGESDEGSEPACGDTENKQTNDNIDVSQENQMEKISLKHILTNNFSEEIEKGNAVRNQLKLWDNLLEARIKLQKCLVTSNRFPQYDSFQAFRHCGESAYKTELSQCKKEGFHLLEKLMQLQRKLLMSYPDTQQILSGKSGEVACDDEEIRSSDEEVCEGKVVNNDEDEKPLKRRKLNDFSDVIGQQHSVFRNYRNAALEKWYNRSKITSNSLKSSNFSAFDMSVVKQIDHILNDQTNLIRRTQKRRSEYHILGKPVKSAKQDQESLPKECEVKAEDDYDPEIYDDDDFYHKLLRELIEKKTADVTDPIQLGRQWTELQKLRKKLKKKVDTKASKGRKIRYVAHSKLVNFMAPIPNTWSDSAMDDLFRSMFGKSE